MGFLDRGKTPPASTKAGTGNRGKPNTDGPGNKPIDYGSGPPGRKSHREIWDGLMEKWGPSPWFGRGGAQMPWSGPPGQERGQRAPRFTPDAGDPRNAGYWVTPPSAEEQAATDAASRQRYAQKRDLLYADPDYMAAKNAGDLKGQSRAMQALKRKMQEQRFIDQGGSADTWRDRLKTEWPVPKPAPGKGSTHNPNGKPQQRTGVNYPALRNDVQPGWYDPRRDDIQKQELPDFAKMMFEGYVPTEDMPPGMTFDMPSNNILSALRGLGSSSNWKSGTTGTAKKPTRGVRRGGGRVD